MFTYLKNIFKTDTTRYFLITSHGQTATLWLAAAMNKHPDIFCTHAYSYPAGITHERELTAPEYIHRAKISAERFWQLSLHEFIKEQVAVTNRKIVGNVHAFTYGYLHTKLSTLPARKRRNLVILNMVRHPVTRITSMYNCWISDNDENVVPSFIQSDFANRCDHITTHLKKTHSIDFTPRNKAFIVSLVAIEDITRDILLTNQHNIFNIVFERMTADKDYFKKIITLATANAVEISDMKLTEMFATKKINRHNNQPVANPREQYETWQDWQKDAFNFIFEHCHMQSVYSKFDYDFNFI